MPDKQPPDLDEQLARMEKHLPERAARMLRGARTASPWVRVPAGVALTAGGMVGFLPILGFWMVPLGLVVLSHDVPALRPPLARGLAWAERRWMAGKRKRT